MEKKIITVETKWIRAVVISIAVSVTLTFAINHNGKFLTLLHQQTQYDNEGRAYMVSVGDPRANVSLYYKSPLGTTYNYPHIF